ncbi:MAG: hypothetical protein RIA08_09310 [Roseovarius sp.]|uniref:hypothetical protein n=1 Tax=Roseobacteraceae TaxID=2854170 RepID=UPI0032ED8E41
MKPPFLTSLLATCALSGAAMADELVTDDLIVLDDLLCVGAKCSDNEPEIPDRQGIKIKDVAPVLMFDSEFPKGDWSIRTGETTSSGAEEFAVHDEDAGTRPFRILGGAAENTLVISEDGQVGINTMLPSKDLHITAPSGAAILGLDSATAFWELRANAHYFQVRNANEHRPILFLQKEAPSYSVYVQATGNVGMGTNTPDAPLELFGDDSYNFFRITADAAAVNNSVDVVFTEGPLGTGELRYNIVDGDMLLDGTLTTGGPTCDSGCDAVFDAEFERLSVSDHAALMWDKGHLPAVGPTLPGAPMNVSEKTGGILNELEHAHIYIEELHDRLEEQEALRQEQAAVNAALLARLEALEALVLR